MLAAVGAGLDERLDPRRQLVARPELREISVVVAVGVAASGAVGERRILIDGAIGAALEHDLEPVEALADAGAAAERGEDRQLRQPRLDVRAAGIVGTETEAAF